MPADASWTDDPEVVERVRPAILSAAARYLTMVRDGRALDPVANLPRERCVPRTAQLDGEPGAYGMEASWD